MAKPVSITKELVDKVAFDIVRTQGMEALTARNIAKAANCSTQPIYKIYGNLDALREAVILQVSKFSNNFIYHYDKTTIPFLNTGLGYIHFAATEKVLFRIFGIENYLANPVFGPLADEYLYALMEQLLGDAPLSHDQRVKLFQDTMIYTNGLAHMAFSGQLGMTEKQVAQRLITFFLTLADIQWEGEVYL